MNEEERLAAARLAVLIHNSGNDEAHQDLLLLLQALKKAREDYQLWKMGFIPTTAPDPEGPDPKYFRDPLAGDPEAQKARDEDYKKLWNDPNAQSE